MTIAKGWDTYAKERRSSEGVGVGDVWSRPSRIGMDVERPQDVVPYLDREVFTPFLGTPGTIVEIGPGAGRFTEVLLPKCQKLIAVDTSPTMIELLKERFADESKIEYHLSKGKGLPEIPDASVDAAFSYGVFVHLQHWDIFNYLQELNRVLKPGGKALIQHSNTFSELGWKEFLREVPRQLNRHKLYLSFIVNSPELMSEFVRRAGLEVEDTLTEVAKRDCITLIRKPA
jgi:ubiquinone/menaquinone biosynthesis C-methylase UbiE